jgi:hypothetical protein
MPAKKAPMALLLLMLLFVALRIVGGWAETKASKKEQPAKCYQPAPANGAGSSWYFITQGIFHFTV